MDRKVAPRPYGYPGKLQKVYMLSRVVLFLAVFAKVKFIFAASLTHYESMIRPVAQRSPPKFGVYPWQTTGFEVKKHRYDDRSFDEDYEWNIEEPSKKPIDDEDEKEEMFAQALQQKMQQSSSLAMPVQDHTFNDAKANQTLAAYSSILNQSYVVQEPLTAHQVPQMPVFFMKPAIQELSFDREKKPFKPIQRRFRSSSNTDSFLSKQGKTIEQVRSEVEAEFNNQ